MKLIEPEKKIHQIILAVCFSLLIHAGAGMFLAFDLSNNLSLPPNLKGLNMIWVSLGTKNNNSGVIFQKTFPAQSPLAKGKTVKEPAKNENQYLEYGTAEISVTKKNVTGYGINQTAGDISSWGTVTAYPLYRENTPPVYPEIARLRGYEGVVLVAAEILPDGRVGHTKIRKSSGYSILDQSAIKAVKPWKFEPAKKSGKPYTIWVELPIKFILHDANSQS